MTTERDENYLEILSSNASSKDPSTFCLKWSNYQVHVLSSLLELLQAETMVDVTLCTSGGEKAYAHRVVLCAASSYFQEIFAGTEESHPTVILSEVNGQDLRSVLEFVYCGELNLDASRFSSVLQVAATLKITGLMEVSDQLPDLQESTADIQYCVEELPSTENNQVQQQVVSSVETCESIHHPPVSSENLPTEHIQPVESGLNQILNNPPPQFLFQNEPTEVCRTQESDLATEESLTVVEFTEEVSERKKRKRSENSRKEYSEEQLAAALRDLGSGHLLVETATTHHIPRSTLYVRAKAAGIPIVVSRQEHSGENVNAAVQAVINGASLQHASALYQIPKTVLWRRVKAARGREGYIPNRRPSLIAVNRQAAIQALLTGENLSKVSAQYQIPKTTLFREKARLIQTGKLPYSSLKKRDPRTHVTRHSQIKEAVAACREGKMSQALASITYKVPKTTIWRRLHKGIQMDSEVTDETIRCVQITEAAQEMAHEGGVPGTKGLQEKVEIPFAFCERSVQLPLTYVGGPVFSEASLI